MTKYSRGRTVFLETRVVVYPPRFSLGCFTIYNSIQQILTRELRCLDVSGPHHRLEAEVDCSGDEAAALLFGSVYALVFGCALKTSPAASQSAGWRLTAASDWCLQQRRLWVSMKIVLAPPVSHTHTHTHCIQYLRSWVMHFIIAFAMKPLGRRRKETALNGSNVCSGGKKEI